MSELYRAWYLFLSTVRHGSGSNTAATGPLSKHHSCVQVVTASQTFSRRASPCFYDQVFVTEREHSCACRRSSLPSAPRRFSERECYTVLVRGSTLVTHEEACLQCCPGSFRSALRSPLLPSDAESPKTFVVSQSAINAAKFWIS